MTLHIKHILLLLTFIATLFVGTVTTKADVLNANYVVVYYDNNDDFFSDYPYYAIIYEDGYFYLIYSSNPLYARQDDDSIIFCSPENGNVGRFRYLCFKDNDFENVYRSGYSDSQCGFSSTLVYSNHDIHSYYYDDSGYTFSEDVFFLNLTTATKQTAELPAIVQVQTREVMPTAVCLLASLIGCGVLVTILYKFL